MARFRARLWDGGHGGTKSRRKPWRFCEPGQSQPPAVRAVSGI
ncbi:hypothetical protein HMPREF1545_00720 [Oscillibacter sp. KLE 1728]|nr:hypothetical protein HMPREF1545_00720 [Oscillibacter sp. KLE 1728]